MSNVIPMVPPRPTVTGAIRAEAERRGVGYEDFLVELALKGWEKREEALERLAVEIAGDVLAFAAGRKPEALGLLKRAARIILKGKTGAA